MAAFAGNPAASIATRRELYVWDPVVRLFHWTVVAGCILDLCVLEDGNLAHQVVGYVVAVAVAVRLVWGFISAGHARFADFVPSRSLLNNYLRALLIGEEPRYIGHNPAGAVVMLTLIGLLATVSITGWMLTLDIFFGSDSLEKLHQGLAEAILVLAGLHAAAAIYESWRHKDNLVWSMVTGRKRA
jgi:cytochrome b